MKRGRRRAADGGRPTACVSRTGGAGFLESADSPQSAGRSLLAFLGGHPRADALHGRYGHGGGILSLRARQGGCGRRSVAGQRFQGPQGGLGGGRARVQGVQRAGPLRHPPGLRVVGHALRRGDYNIYYAGDGNHPQSSHAGVDDLTDVADDRFPSRLVRRLSGPLGRDSFAHVGDGGNLISSPEFVAWRKSTHHGTFEWFAEEVLAAALGSASSGGDDRHTGPRGWSSQPPPKTRHLDVKGGLIGPLRP